MSGNELEEVRERIDGDKGVSDIADRIASHTIPGQTNNEFSASLDDASRIVSDVVDDLNNWIEIIDVRVYRGGKIGIPCRYRWTIKRWASHDMDQWLADNGWELLPHRKADSYEHRKNELEARYRKGFDGYNVHVNIHVEFTNDVFEALQRGDPVRKAKINRERKEKAKEIREGKKVEE